MVNIVAVSPTGPGNLQAWPRSNPAVPPPAASIPNYTAGQNLANGIALATCRAYSLSCVNDLLLRANISATHVVAVVVGYFQPFPASRARTQSRATRSLRVRLAISPSCTT